MTPPADIPPEQSLIEYPCHFPIKVMGEDSGEININTADQQLLAQVKGIGPATAQKIIDYRQENGEFKSIDELIKVKGIGEKSLAKMRPYLQKI